MALDPVELRQCRKCGQIVLAGDDGIPILADMTLLVGAATIPVLIHPDRALVDFKKSAGRYLFLRRAPKTGVLPQKAWLSEHWCTGRRVRKDDTVPLAGRTGPLPALATLSGQSDGNQSPNAPERPPGPSPTPKPTSPDATNAHPRPSEHRGRPQLDTCSRCHNRFQSGEDHWSVDVPGHPTWTSHVDACPLGAQEQAIAALKRAR